MKHVGRTENDEYSHDCLKFSKWWDDNFTRWTSQKLLEILQNDNDRDHVLLTEIRRFRYEMNICSVEADESELSRCDMIRYKSMKVVRWLYRDFTTHFVRIFGQNVLREVINILDFSITSAIDCICSLPELTEDDTRYNGFVERLVKSLMDRLWLFSTITLPIKKKYMAACVIQHRWRLANSTPKYVLCKKRLLREYNELKKVKSVLAVESLAKSKKPIGKFDDSQ